MGREYVVQSWVKHDQDDWRVIPEDMLDHSPGYSGEQVGNRQAKSNGSTLMRGKVQGWTADKRADIGFYADQNEIHKDNALFAIDPAYKVLVQYQDKLLALETQYDAGLISDAVFKQAKAILDNKHAKAEEKINKLAASLDDEEEEQEHLPVYLPPSPLYEEEMLADYQPTKGEAVIAEYIYNNPPI